MIAMHHIVFGRSPNIINNLLTMSEGDITTYPSRARVVDAPISIDGFDNSIEYEDNSNTRYAYKAFSSTIGTTYNISCFIEMEDGGVPVIGTNNMSGDLRLIITTVVAFSNYTVQNISGNIYRISASRTTTTNQPSFGVIKYATQSNRKFKISGIQLTEGAELKPYQKTI